MELLVVYFDNLGTGEACISNAVLSDEDGDPINCTDCNGCQELPIPCEEDADNDGICDDVDDCIGQYDCDGICNGDNLADDFGVCGGDNTIQGALDYYGSGAVIGVPAGTYYESVSILNDDVSLSCSPGAVIDASGLTSGISISGSQIFISNCEIIGDDSTTHGIVITPESRDIWIEGNRIHGMALENQSNDSPLAYGILAYGSGFDNMPEELYIESNEIYNVAGAGISLGTFTIQTYIYNNNIHDLIPVEYMGTQLSVGIQAQLAQ